MTEDELEFVKTLQVKPIVIQQPSIKNLYFKLVPPLLINNIIKSFSFLAIYTLGLYSLSLVVNKAML